MTKSARTVLLPAGLYRAIKYSIYLLLAVNIGMFLAEEWVAGARLLRLPLDPHALGAAFAQTIDTAAWVVLLLLFELETFVIPDARLTRRLRWTLHGIRAFCYLFILYAFYGYCALTLNLYDAVASTLADACDVADSGALFLLPTGDHAAITTTDCSALAGTEQFWQLAPAPGLIVTDTASLASARWLAWTDVINAGTWLVIVLLLEIDVRLQLAGHFQGRVLRFSEFAKALLYGTLLVCALYWGYAGTFLDFWDAFLWLLAFALIEMNVLEWQAETT